MSRDRARNDSGQYEASVPDNEILEAVGELEPAGTSEVGEAVGLARQNADYRLRKLADAGDVSKKKVGRTLVWSLAE
jgi:predicted transcriptional regulator